MGGEIQKANRTSAYPSQIVVVNAGVSSVSTIADDNDLNKLASIPKFLPILRSSIGLTDDPLQVPHIDSGTLLRLSMSLQTHLRQCSETVQNDQSQLIQRMKEIDTRSGSVQQRLIDKQRRFFNYCEQSKKLQDVTKTLKQLDQSLITLTDRMRQINEWLPTDEQLTRLELRQ